VTISTRIAWASAFFVAVALFYAPLAYGCTRPEMLPTLFCLLGAVIITSVVSMALRSTWSRIPRLVLVCVALLLIQGWWMTGNPVFPSLIAANGGSVNASPGEIHLISFNTMTVTSLLLGCFVVLCTILEDPHQRRFILLCAAASGVLISVFGIVLKLSGEQLMPYFWKQADIDWNDFALYRYHGNAGAFLNLAWPLILVFTRRAYTPTVSIASKVVWTFCSVACASALFLNSSKAALVIGLLILPCPFLTRLTRLRGKILFILGAVTLLIIASGLVASSILAQNAAIDRITNTTEVAGGLEGRLADYQEDLNALPEAGAFGFGPGLYKVAFPYQLSPMRNAGSAVHDFAHEDYLQTALEWGWVGTLWWAILVAGGLYRGLRTYAQRERFASKTERHLLLGAILGVCGTLTHALVDFPLQIPSIRLFFLVLLAVCWASPGFLTPSQTEATPRRRYRLPIPSDELIKTSSLSR
jgi:hypothetical protein